MLKRFFRGLLTLMGVGLGSGIAVMLNGIFEEFNFNFIPARQAEVVIVALGLITGIIFFILSYRIMGNIVSCLKWIERKLSDVPAHDIFLGSLGLTIGLLIALLISSPIRDISLRWVSNILTLGIHMLFGYLGLNIAVKRREELANLLLLRRDPSQKEKAGQLARKKTPKILDTSVIIDGRIFDICKTGFIEGPIVIPSFVLEELRHIADSSDSLKRNRGRRGLDVLNRIQKELDIEVQIYEGKSDKSLEVDSKLLKLGQKLDAKVVTNDYNLNKVAEFQGVAVLNINDLANAVKPVVLPGEGMVVLVIKAGKETGQGVAYLDDGTMIVVDGGKKHVGKTIDVLVTSVLQTSAGRMIFAKPKDADKIVS
ncbi:MAG TPA: PIN/TRAM domain-containing protein [Bacillota bacterium]|nr:PIN/TRAM domain-containing protein [Bacillota bacterium]